MIKSISINNFGPISHVDYNSLGKINLIIGSNGSGKTILLKSLYAATKTIEQYRRGKDSLVKITKFSSINSIGPFRLTN